MKGEATMRRMNNTEAIYLSLTQRAAVVKAYAPLFSTQTTANKPRRLSFTEAMRIRAMWITGKPLKEIARQYLDGRDDHAARLLSGISFLNPSPAEVADFQSTVDAFYAALDECDLGPVDAKPGTARVLPLEQFIRGEFTATQQPAGDEYDEGLTPAPAAEAPQPKPAKAKKRAEPDEAGSCLSRYRATPPEQRPTLGINVWHPPALDTELGIKEFIPGSPAKNSLLRQWDVIVELNHEKVKTQDDMARVLLKFKPGDMVAVRADGARRDGESEDIRTAVRLVSRADLDREAALAELLE